MGDPFEGSTAPNTDCVPQSTDSVARPVRKSGAPTVGRSDLSDYRDPASDFCRQGTARSLAAASSPELSDLAPWFALCDALADDAVQHLWERGAATSQPTEGTTLKSPPRRATCSR